MFSKESAQYIAAIKRVEERGSKEKFLCSIFFKNVIDDSNEPVEMFRQEPLTSDILTQAFALAEEDAVERVIIYELNAKSKEIVAERSFTKRISITPELKRKKNKFAGLKGIDSHIENALFEYRLQDISERNIELSEAKRKLEAENEELKRKNAENERSLFERKIKEETLAGLPQKKSIDLGSLVTLVQPFVAQLLPMLNKNQQAPNSTESPVVNDIVAQLIYFDTNEKEDILFFIKACVTQKDILTSVVSQMKGNTITQTEPENTENESN